MTCGFLGRVNTLETSKARRTRAFELLFLGKLIVLLETSRVPSPYTLHQHDLKCQRSPQVTNVSTLCKSAGSVDFCAAKVISC